MKDVYVELKKQIKGVKVEGIIFHSCKLSSYDFLTQENCKLTIFGFCVNILSTLHIENFVNPFMFHFWGREIP